MIDQEPNDIRQSDSIGRWAWLAALAPLVLATMHGGPKGNMKDLIARMAGKAGGTHEPDWALRMGRRNVAKSMAPGQADEFAQRMSFGLGSEAAERLHLQKLMNDPKTQWPPDAVRHHPDGTPYSRNQGLREAGYHPIVDPQLPTSQKWDKLTRGAPSDFEAPATNVRGDSMTSQDWAGGSGFFPTDLRGDTSQLFGANIVPLDPYELFLAALGPTNFEPPPTRLPPPPGKR
jgi:hypothetical protein